VTSSRPVARVRRFSALPDRNRAVLFALAVAWLVFGALYPVFPGVERLEPGARAPAELRAPHSVTYTSAVLTRLRREEAAAAIAEVHVLDASVRSAQLVALDRRLDRIELIRRDVTLSPPARVSTIAALAEGRLADSSAAFLATAPDATWQLFAAQARATLSRVLSGVIGEADLQDQRERLTTTGSAPEAGDLQTNALAELLAPLVVPTVVLDRERTNALRAEAANAQPPVVVTVHDGGIAVSPGAVLTPADIERLDALGLRSRAVDLSTLAAAALFSVIAGGLWGGS
jgi:membrane-associated HD superfamily phosphohydrolase